MLGRYTGKPELGPEETNSGEVRKKRGQPNQRITGKPGMQEQKARRPRQAPNTRDLWPGQDAEEDQQRSARMQSPKSYRACNLDSLSHEGRNQKLQILASIKINLVSLCS